MLKNKLIIIPFGLDWNWPADYEKQTASILSKENDVIAFLPKTGITIKNYLIKYRKGKKISFLKRIKKNLWIFTPLFLLPFQKNKIIQKINFYLSTWQLKLFIILKKRWRNKNKVLWLFTSQLYFPPSWFGKNYFALYDCVDAVSSLDPQENIFKKNQEDIILKQVKLILTTSRSLFFLHKKNYSRVYFVGQGFDLNLFSYNNKFFKPKELLRIPSPRIGFIGNINYRLNFNLIKEIALANLKFSFIFIGPLNLDLPQDKSIKTLEKIKILRKIPNIFFLGCKPKWQIPNYIKYLDIGFIPYNVKQKFNQYCYPLKIFEYFYLGKPVITTPIDELKRLCPYAIIVNDAQKCQRAINKIIKTGWPQEYIKRQKQLAQVHSWQKKIEKISEIIKRNKE